MNRSPRLMILLASVALLLAGCAARKPGFDDLYARLKEKPGTLETGVLAGGTMDARLGLVVTRHVRLQGITVGNRDDFGCRVALISLDVMPAHSQPNDTHA